MAYGNSLQTIASASEQPHEQRLVIASASGILCQRTASRTVSSDSLRRQPPTIASASGILCQGTASRTVSSDSLQRYPHPLPAASSAREQPCEPRLAIAYGDSLQ